MELFKNKKGVSTSANIENTPNNNNTASKYSIAEEEAKIKGDNNSDFVKAIDNLECNALVFEEIETLIALALLNQDEMEGLCKIMDLPDIISFRLNSNLNVIYMIHDKIKGFEKDVEEVTTLWRGRNSNK